MRLPGGNAAEQLLWQQLRAGQLGVWFRRQVPLLGSCIVDFYAPAWKVVVEVDGGYHAEPARRRADERRDAGSRKLAFECCDSRLNWCFGSHGSLLSSSSGATYHSSVSPSRSPTTHGI
jgi:hypothetical protein